MFDRQNGFHPMTIRVLLVSGFLGLFCCAGIERLFFGGDDIDTPPLLFAVQIFFAVIWIVTLIIIVPIQVLYFRRKNRVDASLLPTATLKDVAGMPFGAYQPDARLPKWIALPILAFFWLLVAVFVLILLLVLLALAVNVFIPQ